MPQSVTVVTRQAIEDPNLTTMKQAMARTPGIVATREATSLLCAWLQDQQLSDRRHGLGL
ncbi:TonB-dependent receptor plug domain-containing protein [Paracoccus sp. pheM1]|nr:TonB-dependent receptor plug domain-containing protein [Paracoccus sp. pheM1]